MIDNLKYWVQKTLPAVYDDSLSLYELIDKVAAKLNEVVDSQNGLLGLDFKQYVTDILTTWKGDGTLETIINQTIFNEMNAIILARGYNLNSEPIQTGETDWTGRLQRLIDKAAAENRPVILTDLVYTVSQTIYLKSNTVLISLIGSKIQGVNVTEILKTDSAATYTNIRLYNITVDAGKVYQDDKLLVCSQFYNVTDLMITKCKFLHSSAGIGLDTCEDVEISSSTFEGMYQMTNSAPLYAGVYGYGITVNESNNVNIHHNRLGTEKDNNQRAWIDRHAVYVTNHGAPGAINSARVKVNYNSIVMKPLAVDSDYITGFEYALKTIGGSFIEFKHNTILNGVGFILLTTRIINGGTVTVEGNVGIDCLKTAVFSNNEDPMVATTFEEVIMRNNYFKAKGEYASGFKLKNIMKATLENNEFVSTIADESKKAACYYLYSDSAQSSAFITKGNIISGFKEIGRIANVDYFRCEDTLETYPSNFVPFEYLGVVLKREVEIKAGTQYYNYKMNTGVGSVDLKYFDRDLNKNIKCVQAAPPLWRDDSGYDSAFLSTSRPREAAVKPGYPMYEIDQTRLLYHNGHKYIVTNDVIPNFGTKAEILALTNAWYGKPVYNTDDKKPYWFDAYALKWKDVNGTILV